MARAHTMFIQSQVLPWQDDGLADVRRLENRPEEAESLYVRSAGMWEALLGPDQPRLATTLHNLGTVCAGLGKPEKARAYLARALSIWEQR